MLQAIAKKKINRFLERLPEDIVTDAVFGGLRYLVPREAGLVLEWLFPAPGFEQDALHGAEVLDAELWPPKRGGREPDALIRCRTANGVPLVIVVEAKWGGYTLDERQALDQWEHFVRPATEIGEALHAIVVDRREVAEARLAGDEDELRHTGREAEVRSWRERRDVILWHDVARRLQRRPLGVGSEQLQRWVEDVLSVFRALGRHPFEGFHRTASAGPVRTPVIPQVFYRRAPGRRSDWLGVRVEPAWEPVFWMARSEEASG
ncbi:hypothetical protein [Siccirubricoccus sp. G192]|uniref:hypothetical protein n=1 Tax=Siccirubricoccus sp. G192 TaxID=2849651 RepID=UPI001C2C83E9|nr:hypothetical protein [Siccirubricoccus sp. G192]MBV1800501.1 hypothetical protein [Siccirubricoccus sp. G192]